MKLSTKSLSCLALSTLIPVFSVKAVSAALITFDGLVEGQTSFGVDTSGDGVDDVVFSTTDPLGFGTSGPGLDQNFINEPGLEGSSLLNPDLRVDFLGGALDSITFGFALQSLSEGVDTFADFNLFDSSGNLLASAQEPGLFTPTSSGVSTFPEGQIQLAFAGTAAFGEVDFSSEFGGFIIDNFEGTFGAASVEPIPEPNVILGLVVAMSFGILSRRGKCIANKQVNKAVYTVGIISR